jgi:5-methylcytosine-specific restriction endonuclease McrA
VLAYFLVFQATPVGTLFVQKGINLFDRLRPVYPSKVPSMTITLRRQIACYTDLAAILALVDPCPRGETRPSFALPSGQTAQASQSLRAFRLKGTRCAECGLQGHHFLEFRTQRKSLSGLCLVGLGDRRLTSLTADHIVPRSLGGAGAPGNLRVLCAECNVRKANRCTVPTVTRFRLAEVKNRLWASYGSLHPSFQKFHRAYLRHFDATASIDDGYVDDAGLVAYAAAIEHQFGLVCDLAGVPGHLFPEGYERT